MSEKSNARHVQREMGWNYVRALYFVRTVMSEALSMRQEGEAMTVKDALVQLARASEETHD